MEALGKKEKSNKEFLENINDDTKRCILEKKQLYEKWLNTDKPEDLEKYREKNREVKRRVPREKNEKWESICQNIEQNIGRTRNTEAWRIIKALRTNNKERSQINYIPGKE